MSHPSSIFVIEDDPSVVEIIREICETRSWPVESFSSAEDFMASQCPTRPGCAILDLRLPGISGLELQTWLAAIAPSLPVILISGYADVESAVRGMRKGAVTLLQKPFTPEQLTSAIDEAMVLVSQYLTEQAIQKQYADLVQALTRNELETVELIVSGKSNKQIAAIQELSLRGVEDRRSRLMKHFGTRSLAEFVSVVKAALP